MLVKTFSIAVALAPFACAAFAQSTATPTFATDIAPIIYSNCSVCHHSGEVAPFTLMSYSDVRAHAADIGTVTQSKYMPPWKPEPGWVAYRDQRGLTPAQIDLIQQWLAAGAPEGDASKEPAPPKFADGWQLGTPDLILNMAQPFSVPADGPDIYRNFVIHTNLPADQWIRAIEYKPSARTVVHHSLFFADNTGAAASQDGIDGQPGFPGFSSVFALNPFNAINGGLGAWVPGTTPNFLPDGVATLLPKGGDFVLQVHFHPNGLAQTEQSTIGLYFGSAPPVQMTQIQAPAFFGIQANINIAAGAANYKVRGSFTLPVDVKAVGVWAHAHFLGRESKLTATLPTGEVRILLWIKDWQLTWQDQYLFKDLIPLPAGTRLDGELTYDNSTANLNNPSTPPVKVTWGEASTDEMGSLLLNVIPNNNDDLATLQTSTLVFMLTPVPLVGNNPLLITSGVTDAASNGTGALTPGKIIVLYGDRIGASKFTQAAPANGKMPTSLAGTQVLFDGVPAPLLYTSASQVAAITPYGIDGKKGTQVQLVNGTAKSGMLGFPVVQTAPSIFSTNLSGSGPSAVLNQDGVTVNTAQSPAPRGSIITIYATGEGQTAPAGVDGLIAASVYPAPAQPVSVTIDGYAAAVKYAGAAPGQVAGLLQVNVEVPAQASTGDVPIVIQAGGASSQPGMTISVK